MSEHDLPPWPAGPLLAELEKVLRAWGEPLGYRVQWNRGSVPLWGVDDERQYLSVDIVETGGRDDIVHVIPLDGDNLVVGLVNGASGICRGWECSRDRLLDVLDEADKESRSCQAFAERGLT